jgi:hypothetical protein
MAWYLIAALALAGGGKGEKPEKAEGGRVRPVAEAPVPRISCEEGEVRQVVAGWNGDARSNVNVLLAKYGRPDGVTEDTIVWMGDGPWHKTTVSRHPVEHNFPVPHHNVVTQWIPYHVPVDKIDEVSRFNGSVVVDRTRGLLGVSGPDESMNVLAVNIVDDIVRGDRDVAEARAFYAQHTSTYVSGGTNEYLEGFRFDVPRDAADPDEPVRAAPGRRTGS